jgi:hypothetical protein
MNFVFSKTERRKTKKKLTVTTQSASLELCTVAFSPRQQKYLTRILLSRNGRGRVFLVKIIERVANYMHSPIDEQLSSDYYYEFLLNWCKFE